MKAWPGIMTRGELAGVIKDRWPDEVVTVEGDHAEEITVSKLRESPWGFLPNEEVRALGNCAQSDLPALFDFYGAPYVLRYVETLGERLVVHVEPVYVIQEFQLPEGTDEEK